MKMIQKTALCFATLLTILILFSGFSFASERIYIIEHKLSFDSFPDEWGITSGSSTSFFSAIRTPPAAKMWAMSKKTEADKIRQPDETAKAWLKAMKKKYPWKNVKIVNDGWIESDGIKVYWFEEEHKFKGKTPIKQKIYSLNFNGYQYLFQFLTRNENFDATIQEYDDWIQTLKFSESFTVPETCKMVLNKFELFPRGFSVAASGNICTDSFRSKKSAKKNVTIEFKQSSIDIIVDEQEINSFNYSNELPLLPVSAKVEGSISSLKFYNSNGFRIAFDNGKTLKKVYAKTEFFQKGGIPHAKFSLYANGKHKGNKFYKLAMP